MLLQLSHAFFKIMLHINQFVLVTELLPWMLCTYVDIWDALQEQGSKEKRNNLIWKWGGNKLD